MYIFLSSSITFSIIYSKLVINFKLFYFSASIKAHPDYVLPLPSSSGIYFDRIGKLKIIKGQLNLITHIDISFINTHLVNLNEILGTVRFMCQQSENKQCQNMLSPLTVRFNDMKRYHDSLSHLISRRNKRSAWFSGIGNVFKQVIGTLNEDDALKYDSAIESVQNDEKKLAQLVKENILVTTSTLNSYKQTINKLKVNEDSLNIALNKLIISSNNITKISNNLIIETKVHSILMNLESSILTLSFQLEDLINAIVLSSQNILHPRILTPAQLYHELVDNDRHLSRDTRIPLSLSLDNIHYILSISDVSCYYFRNKLVFVLQIPLVTIHEFNLYHNLALPIPHDVGKPNVFSLILPSSSYIAISNDKVSFCNLDSLSKCKTINSEFFLCEVSVVLLTIGNPTCESDLLTKTISAIPTQCVTKTILGELDIWKPLRNNRWIFVQSRPNKISIDCDNAELREVIVFGTGILHTPKQCMVYTKNVRLISSNSVVNISIPVPSLDFSIINDSCCKLDTKSDSVNTVSPVLLQNIDLGDLNTHKQNDKLFADLDKIIEGEPVLVKYGTHYFAFTSVIYIIILLFIGFKLYKIVSRYRKKLTISSAKPTLNEDDGNVSNVQGENSQRAQPRLREIV